MKYVLALGVLAAGLLASGCNNATNTSAAAGSTEKQSQPVAQTTVKPGDDDPKAVVTRFLEALRTGNEDQAMGLLSKIARQKAVETNRVVTGKPSTTAQYELGEVEKIGDDGARVATTWKDSDESGNVRSDHALWVCRRESEGWRVCGVAAYVFPGEQPLLMDFEDPAKMKQQQDWLQEEIIRRSKASAPSTQNGTAPLEAQHKAQDAFQR
jgi:hypothetical protein